MTTNRLPGAVFHPITSNSKLAPQTRVAYDNAQYSFRPEPVPPYCSATYVSIAATCPDSCSFKDNGCYVQTDRFMSKAVRRLDVEAEALDGFEVALNEISLINGAFPGRTGGRPRMPGGQIPQDGARGGRDLRMRIGGDVPTAGAAALLGESATGWRARGGGRVWGFTHRWDSIARAAFGPDLSMLASVETPADAKRAMRRGYAPAIVVDHFTTERVFKVAGVPFIPCPNETRGRTCVECRLCLDDHALIARGMGIAFAAHGKQASKIRDVVQLGTGRFSPRNSLL